MRHKHAWRTYVIRVWVPRHAHAFAQARQADWELRGGALMGKADCTQRTCCKLKSRTSFTKCACVLGTKRYTVEGMAEAAALSRASEGRSHFAAFAASRPSHSRHQGWRQYPTICAGHCVLCGCTALRHLWGRGCSAIALCARSTQRTCRQLCMRCRSIWPRWPRTCHSSADCHDQDPAALGASCDRPEGGRSSGLFACPLGDYRGQPESGKGRSKKLAASPGYQQLSHPVTPGARMMSGTCDESSQVAFLNT
jgi:hypothetical protein